VCSKPATDWEKKKLGKKKTTNTFIYRAKCFFFPFLFLFIPPPFGGFIPPHMHTTFVAEDDAPFLLFKTFVEFSFYFIVFAFV